VIVRGESIDLPARDPPRSTLRGAEEASTSCVMCDMCDVCDIRTRKAPPFGVQASKAYNNKWSNTRTEEQKGQSETADSYKSLSFVTLSAYSCSCCCAHSCCRCGRVSPSREHPERPLLVLPLLQPCPIPVTPILAFLCLPSRSTCPFRISSTATEIRQEEQEARDGRASSANPGHSYSFIHCVKVSSIAH